MRSTAILDGYLYSCLFCTVKKTVRPVGYANTEIVPNRLSTFLQHMHQPRSQGLSSSRPLERERGGKKRDSENEVAYSFAECESVDLLPKFDNC